MKDEVVADPIADFPSPNRRSAGRQYLGEFLVDENVQVGNSVFVAGARDPKRSLPCRGQSIAGYAKIRGRNVSSVVKVRELGELRIEKSHELGHFRTEIAARVVRRHHRPSLGARRGDCAHGRKRQDGENCRQPYFT